MIPTRFTSTLESRKFTNGADRGFVADKYGQTFIEVMASAKTLDFRFLGWGSAEGITVAEALPSCTVLESFFIDSNPLGVEGGAAICAAVPKTVQFFLMANCSIGDEGAKALAARLLECPAIEKVSLEENGIGDDGATAVVEAAIQMSSLISVGIFEENSVSDKCREVLKNAWTVAEKTEKYLG